MWQSLELNPNPPIGIINLIKLILVIQKPKVKFETKHHSLSIKGERVIHQS